MKIGFIIPYFYPAWQYGGPVRAAYDLARGLVRRGHDVRVITTDSGGNVRLGPNVVGPKGRNCVDGIEIVYYRNLSNRLAYRQRAFLPRRLHSEMRKELSDRDVIHMHELRSMLSVFGMTAAKALHKPYVLTPHGGIRHLGKQALKTIFDAIWGRRILREASAIVALTPIEQLDIQEFGVNGAFVRLIPNAIDALAYSTLPDRKAPANRRIVFMGRLHRTKGADLLIEAFALARGRLKDRTELWIIGADDGDEANLRALAAKLHLDDAIRFTGFLSGSAKMQALCDGDLTVIPSRERGFPVTILESMMCGTPVLLSSACRLAPMPSAEEGLQQFESENVEDLARQLIEILSRPRVENTKTMQQFVRKHFSLERIAEQTESLYRELCTKS